MFHGALNGRLTTPKDFGTVRREGRLSGSPARLLVSRGVVTSTPVPFRVIACWFPRQALSPPRRPAMWAAVRLRRDLAARQTWSGDRVGVRLVLRHPTSFSERRLRTPRTEVVTGVARLRRVRRVRFPYQDTHFEGFVLDASGKTRERSVVETPVHPLLVVEMLADVRQVFEHDNRVLKGLGVFDRFAGRLLHDVREGVLVGVESLIYAPLGSVTLSESLGRGMHLFAEVPGAAAIVDGRLSWSIVVRQGTARQEFGFADVEADRRRLVRFLWFRNLVLDGDVKHPTRPVFLELKLSNCHVAVEQVIPQLTLSGVDAERDREGGTTSDLWNAPAELVFAFLRVVDVPPPVRESDGVVVVQLQSVVRPMELWDVVLERVLRIGREDVVGDDLVDHRLRVRPTLERFRRAHGGMSPWYAEAVALCSPSAVRAWIEAFSWR